MQMIRGGLFFVVFMVGMLCLSVNDIEAGGFKKYEDFEALNPGVFQDNDKFVLSSGCQDVADVTIENFDGSRQVKFSYKGPLVPLPTPPDPRDPAPTDTSCWLAFNNCPERIVGIKANVTVTSCAVDQDCRARFAWHRGISPADVYLWEQVTVRPSREDIAFGVSQIDQNDNYNYLSDMFWGIFGHPLPVILGETFTMTALFDKPDAVTVSVEGLGTTTYKLDKKMGSPIEIFKGIGMRVGSGGAETYGVFEAYFDNVAVKTKGSCDKKKPVAKAISPKKKLAADACFVDITFSEPMYSGAGSFDIAFDPNWAPMGTSNSFEWSDDRKTVRVTRTPCTQMPVNTKISFMINPDGTAGGNYFSDLKGNPAPKKKLVTKTDNP